MLARHEERLHWLAERRHRPVGKPELSSRWNRLAKREREKQQMDKVMLLTSLTSPWLKRMRLFLIADLRCSSVRPSAHCKISKNLHPEWEMKCHHAGKVRKQ